LRNTSCTSELIVSAIILPGPAGEHTPRARAGRRGDR
jgi:hypothetical protein